MSSLLLGGCRADPFASGANLRDCTTCPDGFRCVEGVCLNNSLPQLRPLGAYEVLIGDSITVHADVSDPDGDDITVTWTQVKDGAPVVLAEPVVGTSLTIQPAQQGAYVFEAVASDGYGTSPPATLTVVVLNALPTVQPQKGAVAVLSGTQVELDPAAADTDAGQTVVVRWSLVSGPDITFAPEGDTLTITPTQIGLYVFAATPFDGHEEGASEHYRVMVEPAAGTVFVSGSYIPDAEHVDTLCGTVDNPCKDLAEGLARARATSGSVMVAALTGGAVYNTCVDLVGTEQLIGGLDPLTWELSQDLIERTVIACDQPNGHRMSGDSLLSHVRLTNNVQGGASAHTLQLRPGSQRVINVDVEAPACGPSCFSAGVVLRGSDATLSGVDVWAKVVGFRLLDTYAGIIIQGGAPHIEGRLGETSVTDRHASPGARGHIQMNAPVTNRAWGVLSARALPTLTGLWIMGGLGLQLEGVQVHGGHLTMDGNVVEVTGFGSQSLGGVTAVACETEYALCQCPLADCSGLTVGEQQPLVTLNSNTVRLLGATDPGEPIPCVGSGLSLTTQRPGQHVVGNHVEVLGAMTLGVGIRSLGYSDPFTAVDLFQDNHVVVDGGDAEPLCLGLAATQESELSAGAIGLALGGFGTRVINNEITVGAHRVASVGTVLLFGASYLVERNIFNVAQYSLAGQRSPTAVGAMLQQAMSTSGLELPLPLFTQNEVRMGGEAVVSAAVSSGASMWTLSGNMLHGGTGTYSNGVIISTRTPSSWPVLIHNTIVAGGDPAVTLGSRAVVLDARSETNASFGAPAHNTGTFLHNLIDAGSAGGRRYIYDSLNWGFAHHVDDRSVHQWVDPMPSVGLSRVFSYATGTTFASSTYVALLADAGEIVTLTNQGGSLRESVPVFTGSRVLSTWAGEVDGEPWAVAITENGIAQARVDRLLLDGAGSIASPFVFVPQVGIVNGQPVAIQATAAVGLELGARPADLVVAERGDTIAGGALWFMEGSTEGFAPGRPLTGKEPWGEILSINARENWLFVLERTDAGGTLDLWVRAFEGSRQRERWNLSALVSHPAAEVRQFEVHDLGAPTNQTCDPTAQGRLKIDITLAMGEEILTFIKPCLGASLPNPMVFQSAVCAGAAPKQLVFGDVVNGTTYDDLLVACDTDVLEAFLVFPVGEPSWYLAAQGIAAGEVISMAPRPHNLLTAGHAMIAERVAGSEQVQMYEVNATAQTITPSAGLVHTFASQGARRGNNGPEPDFTGALPAPLSDASACTLAFRQGGDAYDLSLTGGAACLDTGQNYATLLGVPAGEVEAQLEQLGASEDLHGDLRDRNAPDIGADEVP